MEKDSGINKTPNDLRIEKLVEAGRSTQFNGERANPQAQDAGSNKPWSIHNSIRYFAAQSVDEDDQPVDEETRKRPMKKILGRNPTRAELIAMKQVQKAQLGDQAAAEFVTERVDGKVANMNMSAELAQIQNMTDEQINEQLDRFYVHRNASDPNAESGISDAESPATTDVGTAGAGS